MSLPKQVRVADVLIRGVPDEVLAAIDVKAGRLGISRTEYLRRALDRERVEGARTVSVDALEQMASMTEDLGDPDVMAGAWR